MPTDDDRRALFAAAETALGARAANTLMELLPPVGWADVATRRDVESLGHQVRREMADLRTELKGEVAGLRVELTGEMAGLRGEMALMESRIVRASIYGSITVAGLALAAGGVAIAAVTAL